MNRATAKKVCENIKKEDIRRMFFKASEEIQDWTVISKVNKGMTLGTSWNILTKGFDDYPLHRLEKINMIHEFGDFLEDHLKPIKKEKDKPVNIVHQSPNFKQIKLG